MANDTSNHGSRRATPTRREFCAGAGACLLLAGVPACVVDTARVGEGTLTSGDGTHGAPDAAGEAGDLATGAPPPNADLAGQAVGDLAAPHTCTPASVDAGAASSYAVGATPRYLSSGNLFVVRDTGGLFAVSASCTHQGVTVQVQNGVYVCPKHGATFAFDGSQPTLPAITPLRHLAMCVDGGGNVTVDPSKAVPAGTRY